MSKKNSGTLKHGGNYLIASIATSALAFISIPVYTRILTPKDYGVVSVFIGVVSILSSVISFSTDRSVSRYFFDQKDDLDFKRFVGTSSILALTFFIVNSALLVLFADEFGTLVGLPKNVVYLIVPISFINIIGLTFEQIHGPLKRSKEIAFSSVFRVFLGFAFSVAFILLSESNKFYGQIIGQIISGIVIVFIWARLIKPFFEWSFDVSYVKYIFTYSVPLIPYALSGVIIEQFGKVAIGGSQGLSQAGFYNLALTVSSIVNIIIGVTHQAWNPYYFEYMNSKNYTQLDSDFTNIFKITLFVAFGVASFGREIGLLLATEEFSTSLYLVPIFTVGYIFYQLAYMYLRNFGFSKKTYYMTVTVLASGISNLIFNSFLIDKFGELGAAFSFVLSYLVMAIVAWVINKYLVNIHSTSLSKLFLLMLLMIPFYCLLYYFPHIDSILIVWGLKLVLTSTLGIILFWTKRTYITSLLVNKFNSIGG